LYVYTGAESSVNDLCAAPRISPVLLRDLFAQLKDYLAVMFEVVVSSE